ncbi:hypothetical protein ABZS88_35355 [Streptomyces sp. NPDC005480]|uniref:hypothetical protein n=1 Tax=Streptomyces sp. NPDC005480 TaxID=3154880 RepID=UPI0033A38EB8
MHDSDAALYVVEGVAGERSSGGGRGEMADAGPGVQRGCAIAQFGDDVVERRSERGDGTRVRDEVDAERAGELLLAVRIAASRSCPVSPGSQRTSRTGEK